MSDIDRCLDKLSDVMKQRDKWKECAERFVMTLHGRPWNSLTEEELSAIENFNALKYAP
jgi:hypothetical protein